MDWSRERYVRLYVRDSGTWVLLSWQARCVLPLLMRKLDRAGRLAIPTSTKPEVVIQKLLDVPMRVVRPALEELAAAGIVELTVSGLVMPNFPEAQDCIAPSTERVRKHRDRKEQHKVAFQNVSETLPVSDETPCRTVPSLAVLSRAVPSPLPPEGADEREWGEVAAVCDRLPWIAAKGKSLLSPRDRIRKLVANGADAAEIVRVLEGLAAAVEAGKEPASSWNAQYVFSGHYDRLRTAYGGGAEAVEKPGETLAERLRREQEAAQ
jgi:hypothetical protein